MRGYGQRIGVSGQRMHFVGKKTISAGKKNAPCSRKKELGILQELAMPSK